MDVKDNRVCWALVNIIDKNVGEKYTVFLHSNQKGLKKINCITPEFLKSNVSHSYTLNILETPLN